MSKEEPYPVRVANGMLISEVHNEVVGELRIRGHQEKIRLDVVEEMVTHDMVLGLPWLQKHNPDIDWGGRKLLLTRCECVNTARPTHRQRSMVDEEAIEKENDVPTQGLKNNELNLVDANGLSQVKKRKLGNDDILPRVPLMYRK